MKDSISSNTELQFYKVLKGKINLAVFEKWVYENKMLETELTEDVYIELIALNYKGKFAINELRNIINPFINHGQFEKQKIINYLESIINRDENCADSILMTYELYCKGYDFFRKIGLKYGLDIAVPRAGNYMKSFEEISKKDQNELLDKIYPFVIEDAKNALAWIVQDQIVFKPSEDEIGNFKYEDFRTHAEQLKSEF